MRSTAIHESRRLAPLPMNLDIGRMTVLEAAQVGMLALVALFIATLAIGIARVAGPGEAWSTLHPLRQAVAIFAWSVALMSGGLSAVVVWLTVATWMDYRNRIADYHALYLDLMQAGEAVETETTIHEWELSPSRAIHILAVAVAIHQRVQAGDTTPWSVRGLTGPTWLGRLRLGDVPAGRAQEMTNALEQLGLIADRGPRKAGSWQPRSTDDIVMALTERYGKIATMQQPIDHEV